MNKLYKHVPILSIALLSLIGCNQNPMDSEANHTDKKTADGGSGIWVSSGGMGITNQYRPALTKAKDNNNMEVVVVEGTSLRHYYYSANNAWVKEKLFGSSVSSAPAITTNLNNKNLELVVKEGTNLRHYYRSNTTGNWTQGNLFGSNVTYDPAIVFNKWTGNLEVIYCEGSQLRYFYRSSSGNWNQGPLFGSYVCSSPSMVYNVNNNNLEVVYREVSQVRHYYRSNATNTWNIGNLFGQNVTGAPAIEINKHTNFWGQYDSPNLHVVVKEGENNLNHYIRWDSSNQWQFMGTITTGGDLPALCTLRETEYHLLYKIEANNSLWQYYYQQ